MSDLALSSGLLIRSFSKYLFSTHYVPGSVPDPEHRTISKRDTNPCPHGAYPAVGETDNTQRKQVKRSELVVNAKENAGKHDSGEGDGEVQSGTMTSQCRPQGREGGVCGGESAPGRRS